MGKVRLPGALAVVTGAGSGIGRATAARFAADGARVVVVDIDEAAAKETADQLGSGHAAHAADVSNAVAMAELAATVVPTPVVDVVGSLVARGAAWRTRG